MRMTRKKLIKFKGYKYSKGYLDKINEITFQDEITFVEEKKFSMFSYVKNPYHVVPILVTVVLAMIPLIT